MTAQTASPPMSTVAATSSRSAQVRTMEVTARRALTATKGVREGRIWVEEGPDGTTIRGEITVTTAQMLPTVVSGVADDLIETLEDMQGRQFDRHDLNFMIAPPPGGAAPQQTLTIV